MEYKEKFIFERKKSKYTKEYDINYYFVRDSAWEFLIKNDIKSFPLDLQYIIARNKWLVMDYSHYCAEEKVDIKELITEHPSGFTHELTDGNYLICYNESFGYAVNRFTISHEIGHIMLKHRTRETNIEKEAELFAARILMPTMLIHELNLDTPEKVAQYFKVSLPAAKCRTKRYKGKLLSKNKFYMNELERELYNKLKNFIKKQKEK